MSKLIEDVRQPKPFTMTNGRMIATLYKRGVTIEQIFGQYYAMGEGVGLTVGDALLAQGESPPKKCKHGRVHYCSDKECWLHW